MSLDNKCNSRETLRTIILAGAIVLLGFGMIVLDSKLSQMQETLDGFAIVVDGENEPDAS